MHTVEKIGGTSMSRFDEVLDTLFIGTRKKDELYNRVFVVSAYGGMTNLLLEHKKSGEPGVYERFADAQNEDAWLDALSCSAVSTNVRPPTASSKAGSAMCVTVCSACNSCAPTATFSSPNIS